MPQLFDSFQLRDVTFRNRVAVSPMCQYSAKDGLADDWHLVHLGARAVGGAGLVIAEASAVEPRGRISLDDLGIWDDAHVAPLSRITRFIAEQGAVAGIQLAHAGRKASTRRPWHPRGGNRPLSAEEGAYPVVGASPLPFADGYPVPSELSRAALVQIRHAFRDATVRAKNAGFRFVEVHGAHGYLLHSFLSPLSNQRGDEYGGTFENRTRLLREVVNEVREVWPSQWPLAVRLSATDWVDGGWTPEETVALARALGRAGVDLVDCSSGGNSPAQSIPLAPGYQVQFAEAVKRDAGVASAAVGLITEAEQADEIIRTGRADLVFLARELLRDPHWPLHAARVLKQELAPPAQYQRAF